MSFSLLSAANIRTLSLKRREIFLWKLKILDFNWFKIESSSSLYDCLPRVLFHNIFGRISALTGQLCWLTQWPNTSLVFLYFSWQLHYYYFSFFSKFLIKIYCCFHLLRLLFLKARKHWNWCFLCDIST